MVHTQETYFKGLTRVHHHGPLTFSWERGCRLPPPWPAVSSDKVLCLPSTSYSLPQSGSQLKELAGGHP